MSTDGRTDGRTDKPITIVPFDLRRGTIKQQLERAYQLVKDLISEKHGRLSTIQFRSAKVLLKYKRFSADGQNIAQNYTIMRHNISIWFCTKLLHCKSTGG